jgi:hypothetical protein
MLLHALLLRADDEKIHDGEYGYEGQELQDSLSSSGPAAAGGLGNSGCNQHGVIPLALIPSGGKAVFYALPCPPAKWFNAMTGAACHAPFARKGRAATDKCAKHEREKRQ